MALLPQDQKELLALRDIPRYNIELNVSADATTYTAHVGLNYTNTETLPIDNLHFHLLPNGGKSFGDGSLEIIRTAVDGREIKTTFNKAASIVQVPLQTGLQPGEHAQVEFETRGAIPQDFGGEMMGGYGIFNQTQGVLALSGWYPMLAVYDDLGWHLDPVSSIGDSVYADAAFYNVEVIMPSQLEVAATGVEYFERYNGSSSLHCFISGPVREFSLTASAKFQPVKADANGVQVSVYHLPGHARAAQAALEIAIDSLRIFNARFGPYPYTELDVVEAPMQNALGVEFPGLILISSKLFDDPDSDSFIVTTAHEVAHQWWYNLVGNDVFNEPWLDEGLTTFSSSLLYEEKFGSQGYAGITNYWEERFDQLVQDGADDLVTQSLTHFESLKNSRIYATVVYTKAALFFAAMRQEFGDERFFRALQSYYSANKYQIASVKNLREAFQKVDDGKLDSMMHTWLYSTEKTKNQPPAKP